MKNLNLTQNVSSSVMNFQRRNRCASSAFIMIDTLFPISDKWGQYDAPTRCRCHHFFTCWINFATSGWACHNAREGVMKKLVHLSQTKRTPTQIMAFIQIDFSRFTRPIRCGSRCSVRTRWKDSTFFIIGYGLQRRWANTLPVFLQNITCCCVLLAEKVVMKARNVFQMAWNQQRNEMKLHCLWFLTLGRIRVQEMALLISSW